MVKLKILLITTIYNFRNDLCCNTVYKQDLPNNGYAILALDHDGWLKCKISHKTSQIWLDNVQSPSFNSSTVDAFQSAKHQLDCTVVSESCKHTRWAQKKPIVQSVNNFLSFYSVILKQGTNKELVIFYNPMFFVFKILAFFAGKWRHKFGAKFWLW